MEAFKKSSVARSETTSSSGELLTRARAGDERALSQLFRRHGGALRRWARGRLPRWARSFNDTADIVQDALLQTFKRIDRFDDRGKGALQAYLRRAVVNRITDEVRMVGRSPALREDHDYADLPAREPSPYELALTAEKEAKYKAALTTLTEDERLLVVGRMELSMNYAQLALVTNRNSAEAARQAVRRAVIKLAHRMSGV